MMWIYFPAFELQKSVFQMIGLPRNDRLTDYKESDVKEVRNRLGIAENKKVILYAPTFREFQKGSSREVVLDIPLDLQHWQEILGRDFVILFRAHYEVARHMRLEDYPVFLDVSTYPELNDLMLAADGLISDYSSIYFDFSLMQKPMYCFAYDYEEYMEKRGLYFKLEEELPCHVHRDEESLLEELLRYDENVVEKRKATIQFRRKFVTEYGNAAKKSCDVLYEVLNNDGRKRFC